MIRSPLRLSSVASSTPVEVSPVRRRPSVDASNEKSEKSQPTGSTVDGSNTTPRSPTANDLVPTGPKLPTVEK